MFAKIKKTVFATLCVILSAALITTVWAWFAGVWNSGSSKVDFVTSGNSPLGDMWYWMYESPFEVTGSNKPRWIMSSSAKASDNSGFVISPYETNTEETGDQFILNSLHFGKIDNLTSLNPDNRIYFCFKLNSEIHGHEKVSFHFDYATYDRPADKTDTDVYPASDPRYSITLYNMKREEINHFTQNGLAYDPESRPALMELLEFTYCISTTPPPEAETVTGNDPFGGNIAFSSPTPIMHDLLDQSTGLDDSVEDYYLYVCMSPKLENFGLHDHILEFFAQSYMLFDVSFSFEVHD